MQPSSSSTDLVLLVGTPGPLGIDPELIDQACGILRLRLEIDAIVTTAFQDNLHLDTSLADQHDRVVILPCGFESIPLDQ
ncbi:MAG: hypothetical protein ACKOOI_14965, partial [Pirellula sp.]